MGSPLLDICFKKAIAIERMLCAFYQKVAQDFAQDESVRRFFLDLALDENEHAQALEAAHKGEPQSEALQAKAKEVQRKLEALHSQVDEIIGRGYSNLNETFQRMHDIEKTEVDHIFVLLVSGTLGAGKDPSEFRKVMDEHLGKVVAFDREYPAAKRVAILPA